MKTNFVLRNGLRRTLRGAAATAALLLASGFTALGQNPHDPTTVDWDCVMSGAREGLAQMRFSGNFSVSTFSVLVPKTQKNGSSQGRGGDDSRNGTAGGGNPPLVGRQIFGFGGSTGPWNYDSKGRVIGYFVETSTLVSCLTNPIPQFTNIVADPNPVVANTNAPDANQFFCAQFPVLTNNVYSGTNETICYTNEIICTAITNAISFVGNVVTGKRLTLKVSTPFGPVTYRGVPVVPLPNICGSWYGVKTLKNKETFNEFFTMSSSVDGQNIYDVTGAGPDYSYTGSAILSAQKKIAFVFGMTPIPASGPVTVVRAVFGSFNAKKVSGATHGWDQPGAVFTDPMRFDVTRIAPCD